MLNFVICDVCFTDLAHHSLHHPHPFEPPLLPHRIQWTFCANIQSNFPRFSILLSNMCDYCHMLDFIIVKFAFVSGSESCSGSCRGWGLYKRLLLVSQLANGCLLSQPRGEEVAKGCARRWRSKNRILWCPIDWLQWISLLMAGISFLIAVLLLKSFLIDAWNIHMCIFRGFLNKYKDFVEKKIIFLSFNGSLSFVHKSQKHTCTILNENNQK